MGKDNKGKTKGFVATIERVGNKIPHPMYMFTILLVVVMILSAILSAAGVSVTYMAADKTGELTETTVSVVNLLSQSSLQTFLGKIISNFSTNSVVPPIIVLSMFMMVADQAGFFEAGLRKILSNAPNFLVTYLLAVVCICVNICSAGGYVLAVSLGVIVYRSKGRDPIAGILVGWAASAAGYTANLLPATTDVTLAAIADTLAQPYGYSVHPLSHWYFMITATFILAGVTTLIAETFLKKIYPDPEKVTLSDSDLLVMKTHEQKGLKWAGIAAAIFVVAFLIMAVPQNGFFRSKDGQLVPSSPLMSGLLMVIAIFFLMVGVSYGFGSGRFTKAADIPKAMAKGISSVSGMLVVFFMASQFTYAFNTSNLGTIISIKGQVLLNNIGLKGIPLFILFALLCGLINLFVPSAATKWMALAPIFVPMFAGIGMDPNYTMLAYRIGDTITNNITPLNSGLPIAISKLEEVNEGKKDFGSGIGTIISVQLPFSAAYFVSLVLMMIVFYTFHIPLGPGM